MAGLLGWEVDAWRELVQLVSEAVSIWHSESDQKGRSIVIAFSAQQL